MEPLNVANVRGRRQTEPHLVSIPPIMIVQQKGTVIANQIYFALFLQDLVELLNQALGLPWVHPDYLLHLLKEKDFLLP